MRANLFRVFGVVACVLMCTLGAGVVRAEISDADFSAAMDKFLGTETGQKRVADAMQTYFQGMQEKARKEAEKREAVGMEEQFKSPIKMDVTADDPVKGPANAKVTIIEFSDFQCPFCKRGAATMDKVLEAYPQEVKLVFRHLPLDFHPNAEPAARAAYAAGKQGKFWEMHNELFANQSKLGESFYDEAAKKIGLNLEKFKADYNSPEAKAKVQKDAQSGQKVGIQGTPGFLVNGVKVSGAQPVEQFKKIIDRWLGKTPAAEPAK